VFRGERKPAAVCCRDFDFEFRTLKLNRDLDIQTYISTTKRSCYVKPFKSYNLSFKKYENSFQGHRSRLNVTNFLPLLEFAMENIPTKLDQFLFSSF